MRGSVRMVRGEERRCEGVLEMVSVGGKKRSLV
jgi:hypothetical protein